MNIQHIQNTQKLYVVSNRAEKKLSLKVAFITKKKYYNCIVI